VEITQRCNLACLHCGSDCGSQPRADELSPDEWAAFFDTLGRRVDTSRLVMVVTGGEPLCAPGLDVILAGLARNRLAWGMVSNGWALDPVKLNRLVDHGLQSLTLSLDGLRDSHDWLRGRSGSFDRVVAAIAATAQAGLPFFDVVTARTRATWKSCRRCAACWENWVCRPGVCFPSFRAAGAGQPRRPTGRRPAALASAMDRRRAPAPRPTGAGVELRRLPARPP